MASPPPEGDMSADPIESPPALTPGLPSEVEPLSEASSTPVTCGMATSIENDQAQTLDSDRQPQETCASEAEDTGDSAEFVLPDTSNHIQQLEQVPESEVCKTADSLRDQSPTGPAATSEVQQVKGDCEKSPEEDDVQFLEERRISVEARGTSPIRIKPDPEDIIDLTMDDDEIEEDERHYKPPSHVSENSRIKSEIREEDLAAIPAEQPINEDTSMADYHDLPELRPTAEPERDDAEPYFGASDDFTGNDMANMLGIYQKNSTMNEWESQSESMFVSEYQNAAGAPADNASTAYSRASDSATPAVKSRKGSKDEPKGRAGKAKLGKITDQNRVTKKQQPSSKGAKRKKRTDVAVFNPTSLFNHDIIAEANANQGKAAQPGFTSKVKKDALSQLFSSIPAEERDLYIGDRVDLKKATENFNGRGALKADGEGTWKLRGMKSSLRNYQLLGVSWMRSREKSTGHPRGGILSDDMGLGKTVSALANIVDGKPGSDHTGPKATLIVVPASLVNQWLAEVDKHVEIFRHVLIYRSKMKCLDPITTLSSHDIVITSYQEVARSIPKNNPPPNLTTALGKAEWWEQELEKKGPLHRINWHRIVLDEAQAIKNHLSKSSEAICLLQGRYRWCLSGTPVQNSLEEFYPYFRFLRCPNTGSFELFKQNFAKRGSDKALQRLQVYLGKIMLRRTHVDQLFGRPILQLPPIKPVETIEAKFNSVERAVYNIVKHRFVMKVQSLSKQDSPDNNYQQIFVLLLRLRQLVGHPMLIQKTLKDLLEAEDLERLWSLTQDKELVQADANDLTEDNQRTVHVLRAALASSQDTTMSYGSQSSSGAGAGDNELSGQFAEYLKSLRRDGHWANANARAICCACGSP